MNRLLIASLALNVLLSAIALRSRSAAPRPIPRQPRLELSRRQNEPARRPIVVAEPTVATTPWARIESNDPATFLANLRAAGCPEQTIREILVVEISRKYRNAWVADEAARAASQDFIHDLNANGRYVRQLPLRYEMQSSLEKLFGQPWGTLATSLLGWKSQGDPLEFIAAEKKQAMRDLERRFDLAKSRLGHQLTGDPPDPEELEKLDHEKLAELSQLLDPAELREYQVRNSPAAQWVRDNLPAAKSEAEFRTMVAVAERHQPWRRSSETSSADPDGLLMNPGPQPAAQELSDRRAEFDAALREALGPERVAEREAEEQARLAEEKRQQEIRDQERISAELAAVGEPIGVSPEEAMRFYEAMKPLESEIKKFEESLSGTEKEKQKALEERIKPLAEKIAVEVMGEKGRAFVAKLIEKSK